MERKKKKQKKTMWEDLAAITLYNSSEEKVYLLKIKYMQLWQYWEEHISILLKALY